MEANKIIKKYLTDNGITYGAAADLTGYTPQHIEAVCNGRARVSAKMLLIFEKLSGGKISAARLMS